MKRFFLLLIISIYFLGCSRVEVDTIPAAMYDMQEAKDVTEFNALVHKVNYHFSTVLDTLTQNDAVLMATIYHTIKYYDLKSTSH